MLLLSPSKRGCLGSKDHTDHVLLVRSELNFVFISGFRSEWLELITSRSVWSFKSHSNTKDYRDLLVGRPVFATAQNRTIRRIRYTLKYGTWSYLLVLILISFKFFVFLVIWSLILLSMVLIQDLTRSGHSSLLYPWIPSSLSLNLLIHAIYWLNKNIPWILHYYFYLSSQY